MGVQIISGPQHKPVKALIYGPKGVGKSTLAAQFPKPIFIDVEGGTTRLDVQRTQRPTSWAEFRQIIADFARDTMGYQTLVIDTADWAEHLSIRQICAANGSQGLGFGSDGKKDFGASYNQLQSMWSEFLTQLEADFIDTNRMHVVFLAHSTTKGFELPEEEGQYDRYQLAMEKKSAAVLMDWVELAIFVNYRTIVNVETNSDGKIRKAKGTGGTRRMMYASRTAAWDAGNRFGLPDEMDLGIAPLAGCFCAVKPYGQAGAAVPAPAPAPAPAPVAEPPNDPVPGPPAQPLADLPQLSPQHLALQKLMQSSGVTWEAVSKAVADRRKERGQGLLYPEDTPFANIPVELIDKLFMPRWNDILAAVKPAA